MARRVSYSRAFARQRRSFQSRGLIKRLRAESFNFFATFPERVGLVEIHVQRQGAFETGTRFGRPDNITPIVAFSTVPGRFGKFDAMTGVLRHEQ